MVQSNVDWDKINSAVLTTSQTGEGVTTINIQMPFRPDKPVYRVVLAEFQAKPWHIMKVEHAYHPNGFIAYRPNILGWFCREIPPSERKSTRQ